MQFINFIYIILPLSMSRSNLFVQSQIVTLILFYPLVCVLYSNVFLCKSETLVSFHPKKFQSKAYYVPYFLSLSIQLLGFSFYFFLKNAQSYTNKMMQTTYVISTLEWVIKIYTLYVFKMYSCTLTYLLFWSNTLTYLNCLF